ncbi:MAG: UvrD-helicase domain-containing protein [Bacteroidales bacterium]
MLTVYRASAGSGKTHLLTGTYLRMLFQEGTTFENILAVTFTNKATEEMKERILSQLFLLGTEPERSDYIDSLKKEFNLPEPEIKAKAQRVLKEILHNYSGYNVSTIDHFFQHTTRAFTREIGLQGGYNIELDQNRVLTEAIDRLIVSLGNEENKHLLDWLLLFANEKIDNARDWNIRKDLFSLSTEILKEEYKKNSDKILEFTSDKKNLTNFIRSMKEIRSNFEELVKELGKKGNDIIRRNGLKATDFTGKSRSAFLIFDVWEKGTVKPPAATLLKLIDTPDKWCPAKPGAELQMQIRAAYDDGLNEALREAETLFDNLPVYQSALESLRYIFTVGILTDIDRNMREYSRENNLMLISDTTELLNKVIDGKDTPFLYEKIGTRIQHFMIDEFQDTSGMQWENFRPLVSESLGQDFDNLIVGDVKQSIYRWRSSDWMLLHDELRRYETEQRQDRVLDTNWRSCRNIIAFNNTFFTVAAKLLQGKFNEGVANPTLVIEAAYDDICQQVSPKKKEKEGHVRVEFIEADRTDAWKEEVLNRLPETLIELQSNGYALKDIAILVRTAKEGAAVAKTLLAYKAANPDSPYRFDVISNDSLYVSQAGVIETIVSFMRFLLDQNSPVHQAIASYNLATNLYGTAPEAALHEYFGRTDPSASPFNEAFAAEVDSIRTLPLFEMTERIISLVVNGENMQDKVYVQAFQDLVLEFISSHTADLSAFLEWWDDAGVKKTISTPDSQDAIRIITIHKSKGLGFKSVIIPFASWTIDNEGYKSNIIWSEPSVEPFNRIPLIPLKYSSALLNTIYAADYLKEKLQVYIDNLNIAYVAFTRAEEEMIIFAPKSKKPESLTDIGSVLYSAVEWASQPEGDKEFVNLPQHFRPEELCFELGDWWQPEKEKEKGVREIALHQYTSVDPGSRLQLRLHGKGYFRDKEERVYGTLMHQILSAVHYPEDVHAATQLFVLNGALRQEEAPYIEEKITRLLEDEQVKPWFSKEARIFTETEILVAEGSFLRPDRVVNIDGRTIVIDYKFGLMERKGYDKQVRQYMQFMSAMGQQVVEGYLWYVELNKIVKVEPEGQLSLF